jgi:hypothetical protein
MQIRASEEQRSGLYGTADTLYEKVMLAAKDLLDDFQKGDPLKDNFSGLHVFDSERLPYLR